MQYRVEENISCIYFVYVYLHVVGICDKTSHVHLIIFNFLSGEEFHSFDFFKKGDHWSTSYNLSLQKM